MAPAEITSVADVIGGLVGTLIGVLVIVFRQPIARFFADGFHMRDLEPTLRQVYAALGVIAILIAVASVFVL